jgi:hypothetical protein
MAFVTPINVMFSSMHPSSPPRSFISSASHSTLAARFYSLIPLLCIRIKAATKEVGTIVDLSTSSYTIEYPRL